MVCFLTLSLPKHKLPLSISPIRKAVPDACERGDVLRGGLNRESVSGNGAPPCILPAPSPKEAHAPSRGQRPSPSRGWGVGEEELRPPSDGSETWDEADTKIKEY